MSNNISLYNKLAQAQQLIIEVMTELGTTPVQMTPPYAVGPVEFINVSPVLDETPDDDKRLGEHIADMTGAFSQMFPDMGDSEKGLLIALYMSLLGFDYQMEDSHLPDFVKLIKRGIITVVYQFKAQIAFAYRPHFVGVQDFDLPVYDWRDLANRANEDFEPTPPVGIFTPLDPAMYRPVDPIEDTLADLADQAAADYDRHIWQQEQDHYAQLDAAQDEKEAQQFFDDNGREPAPRKRSDILPSELALLENPDSDETALVRGLEGQGIYLDDAQRTALLSIFWGLTGVLAFDPDDAGDVALAGLIYKNVIDVVGDRAAEINPEVQGYFAGVKSFDLPDFHWGELNDMTMMFRSMR